MCTKKALMVSLVLIILLISGCQSKQSETTANVPEADAAEQEAAESYEMTTVTINSSNQVTFAPIYFAQSEGYFDEFGIDLEIVEFSISPDAVPLLATGDLDVYAGPISSGILNVFRQDPNVKTVADRGKISEDDSCTFSAILVQKDLYESGQVRGPEDMAGLKVAAATYSIKGYELDKYLALAGLTFDDVEIVTLPTSALVDALNNKAVDAIVTPEFTLTRLMMTGNAAILSRFEEDAGPMQTSILAFGPRLIKDDPELGIRFLAAYLKGVRKYNEGKTEENLQAIAGLTGEDIDLLEQACWPSIRNDGWIDFSALEPYLQWNIETGQMDFTITEEQFWDPSILVAALELLDNE